MKRKRSVFILLMSVMLAVGLMACGDGNGGDDEAVLGPTPTILSTTSAHHEGSDRFDSDGNWMVWEGRDRHRIMLSDGTELTNLPNGLDELSQIHELAYDGRWVVFHAKNPSEPCQGSDAAWADSTNVESWNRVELYAFDTQESDPELIQVTDSMYGEHAITLDNGLLVYAAYDSVDTYRYLLYAIDLNGTTATPTQIWEDVHVSSGSYMPSLDGTDLVFMDYSLYDLIHADLSDLSAVATTVVTLNTVYDGQISDGTVVWQYSNNIYAATPGGFNGGEVELSQGITTGSCYDPVISGDYAAFECYDGADYEIYVAYVGDLAAFAPTVGTGDVQQVTDNAYGDYDPQIAGGYLAWVGNDADGDDELYAASLSEGVFTDIAQVSVNYDHGIAYAEPWEQWYDASFALDGTGTLVWTEFQDEEIGAGSKPYEPWVEFPVAFSIGVDYAPRYLENYSDYQHIKQIKVAGGTAAWITMGAFDRIFAKKVDSEADPVAVTPEWQRGRMPAIDGGILAYQGKPAMECGDDSGDFSEIWYIDLNTDSKKAVQLTSNLDNDVWPAVDKANGIIAWKNEDESTYHFATIPDGTVYDIDDEIYADCKPDLEDGKILMRDNSYDVWVYDVVSNVYTFVTGGDIDVYYKPEISEGIVLLLGYDGDYNLYYYDLNSPEDGLVQATDELLGNEDGWNVNISAGKVVFQGQSPAGSSTDAIYVYNIGDPMDSVEEIFTVEDDDYDIVQIDVEDDLVVWKYAECDPEIWYHNLSSGIQSAITTNYVPDNHPFVKDGVVVWKTGPEGYSNYYMARP